MFAVVPLMHAENLTIQEIMVEHFENLHREGNRKNPHNRGFWDMSLGFARRHRDVVERFGRFPHRNAILGRESTAEEERALEAGGLQF
jgi:uncharacterized protein (DUF924 family)